MNNVVFAFVCVTRERMIGNLHKQINCRSWSVRKSKQTTPETNVCNDFWAAGGGSIEQGWVEANPVESDAQQ